MAVSGADLPALAERVRRLPAVEQVAAFGTALHISGADRDRCAASWSRVMAEAATQLDTDRAGLEDVFIHLMRGAGEAPVMEIH